MVNHCFCKYIYIYIHLYYISWSLSYTIYAYVYPMCICICMLEPSPAQRAGPFRARPGRRRQLEPAMGQPSARRPCAARGRGSHCRLDAGRDPNIRSGGGAAEAPHEKVPLSLLACVPSLLALITLRLNPASAALSLLACRVWGRSAELSLLARPQC